MKETAARNFEVHYYEKDGEENTWVVESHLADDPHDITVTVEIDMPAMTVTGAKIHFERCPMEQCRPVEEKAAGLIGLKVDPSFSRNVMKIFMGPYGCPNIMTLLTISVPGIIYYYYPYLMKTGKMTPEEFWNIMKTEHPTDCAAHTAAFAERK